MKESTQSNRLLKRPRAGDANLPSNDSGKRVKRSRVSPNGDDERSGQLKTPSATSEDAGPRKSDSADWLLSHPLAGQYSNVDPVFTLDEDYLFLGLDTAVHAYSVATSCLFRVLQPEDGHRVVGYRLDPADQSHLYIFSSTGSVSKWDWSSGKQIARWDGNSKVLSIESVIYESGNEASLMSYSVRELGDGKRGAGIIALDDKESSENLVLKSHSRISDLKVARQGRIVVAYGGPHILVGTINSSRAEALEPMQYTWREVTLSTNITCLDIRENEISHRPAAGKDGRNPGPIDLVVGQADGSILVYHDAVNFFLESKEGRGGAPRRLHWHRGPVNAVRWSRDGNYVITGGNEPVMVLWQLDTGRKQFLPHLSAAICNLVVSPSGNLYALKMADNSTMVLSARELQPHATITGLQLRPTPNRFGDQTRKKDRQPLRATAAVLHPRYPDQLLVAVPTCEISEGSPNLANSSVLQTYDIRTNSHVSRQAVARTNATALRISPEGSEIGTPDVRHLDVSQDGKWMATIDAWKPSPQDTSDKGVTDGLELFLKFWRWNEGSNLWELVTRIDGPHFLDGSPVPVLGFGCRPYNHEFVTIGADGILRFWSAATRLQHGLSSGHDTKKQTETWKCRSVVDLQGPISSGKSKSLSTASIAFSEDGSVLAVCLPSLSPTKPGLTLIIDAQKSVIHYSRVGLYSGEPCAARFLGRHLLVASSQSVSIWDTVNDLVRTMKLSDIGPAAPHSASRLLAVNSKTWTFAVAARCGFGNKPCHVESHVQVYDAASLKLLSQPRLGDCPLALLSDPRSGGYIIIDAAANLRRLGSLDNASLTIQPRDHPTTLNTTGLAKQLGSQAQDSRFPPPDGEKLSQSQTKGLASIFDVPSFVLPSASVLFKDVVQSLLGN